MDMTLVVMAAGLGSRYGGVKQIERLGPDGEILMEYAIYDALRAGFDRIVLIIKPSMLEDVRALFGDRIEQRTGIRIDYAFQTPDRFTAARPELAQRKKPLGTAQKFNRAVDVKGLGEVLVRSALKGVHRTVQVTESRHDDDRHFRMLFFDGVKELHAGRPLHTDIT